MVDTLQITWFFVFIGKGAFSREVAFERRYTVPVLCVTLVSSLFFYKIKDDFKKDIFLLSFAGVIVL